MSGSPPLCLRPATQQTFIYFVHHKIGNNKKKTNTRWRTLLLPKMNILRKICDSYSEVTSSFGHLHSVYCLILFEYNFTSEKIPRIGPMTVKISRNLC